MRSYSDMLQRFIRFHMHHAGKIALFSIVLTALGGFFASKISIDTSLKSLLPRDAWSVKNLETIQKKSGSSNDLRLLIWGGSLEDKIKAADAFTHFLKERDDFAKLVQFRTPKDFLEANKYIFIRSETIDLILDKIRDERKKHAGVTDPLGLEATLESEAKAKFSAESSVQENSVIRDEAQEEAQLSKAKELLNRLKTMRSTYSSEDGKYLSIRIVPRSEKYDLKKSRELLDKLEILVADFNFKSYHPEIQTMVYGSIFRNVEKYESIQRDLSFGGWGILAIILIVMLFFRSFWAPMVLIPALITGLAVGMGLVTLMEHRLNTISSFLIMIGFGIGIEFGIHLLSRFLQERKKHDLETSLRLTWASTGRATVTAAVALLMGFALLTFSSFEGFAQFGRVAIVLISCTAVSFLVLTPAWMVLIERWRGFKPWPDGLADIIYRKLHDSPGRAFYRVVKWVRVVSLFILPTIILVDLKYLKFDYSFEEKVPTSRALPADFKQGSVWTERTKPSAIAVFETSEEAAQFQDFYDQNSKKFPDVVLVSSLSTFFPLNQTQRIAKLRELADEIDPDFIKKYKDLEIREALFEIQEKAYDYKAFQLSEVPYELTNAFVPLDASSGSLVQLYDRGGRADGKKAMDFSVGVESLFASMNIKPLYSGDEIIFGDIVKRVIPEGPWLILGMFILVFGICFLDFRSFKKAGITVGPVLYGFLATGLVAVLSGFQLNFYNMAALASLGAMVVDNSIHLYHRYLEFKSEGHEQEAGRMATYSVVPTVMTCTATSICGYAGMMFAAHSGIASLGILAVAGLLCCLISTCFFFPSWLIPIRKV